jgi:hypothetical protein
MAGGSVTFVVDTYGQLPAVCSRILCQVSAANRKFVAINSSAGGGGSSSGWGVTVPEAALPTALVLKRGGTDYGTSGTYVAGTNTMVNAGNGMSVTQDVNTCPASTNQPTVTSFVTGVGGVPLATTLTYANVGGAGTVNIAWGDGTSTAGAAESGSSNHTYTWPGVYTITITDASSSTDTGQTVVRVP